MPSNNPKELFQKDTHRREDWAELATLPRLHEAITFAMAVLVAKGRGPDYLAGVNGFVYELLNLSEDDAISRPMPSRQLSSFDVAPMSATSTNPPK